MVFKAVSETPNILAPSRVSGDLGQEYDRQENEIQPPDAHLVWPGPRQTTRRLSHVLFRELPRIAVLGDGQAGGFFVADDFLRRWIVLNRTA